jgi:hypothetical protein
MSRGRWRRNVDLYHHGLRSVLGLPRSQSMSTAMPLVATRLPLALHTSLSSSPTLPLRQPLIRKLYAIPVRHLIEAPVTRILQTSRIRRLLCVPTTTGLSPSCHGFNLAVEVSFRQSMASLAAPNALQSHRKSQSWSWPPVPLACQCLTVIEQNKRAKSARSRPTNMAMTRYIKYRSIADRKNECPHPQKRAKVMEMRRPPNRRCLKDWPAGSLTRSRT